MMSSHLTGVASQTKKNGNPMVDGWSGLSADRVAEVAEHSFASSITHTPTLVFWWTNAMRDKHDLLVKETQESLRAAYSRAQDVVGELHERGVLIQAGTEAGNPFVVPGAALVQEIGLLSEAGLTNEDALAAATTVSARALGLTSSGLIQPGAPADLVALKTDPIENLDALKEIELVVVSRPGNRTASKTPQKFHLGQTPTFHGWSLEIGQTPTFD